MPKQCPLCTDFAAPSLELLLHHIGRVHADSPDFHLTCGIDGCETSFTNYHAFRRHLRKKHRPSCEDSVVTSSEPSLATTFDADLQPDDMSLEPSSSSSHVLSDDAGYHQRVALWILKLKERRMLTQSLTEEILGDVTELCADIISHHDHHTATALRASGLNPADIPGLFADSPFCSNPFSNMMTQYRQLSYYRSHFNFVDPVQVTLGTCHKWTGEGVTRRLNEVKEKFVYIPVLEMLESLLKCPAVYEEVMQGHQRTDGVLSDYCDSPKAKEHPLFKQPNALQLLLYFDELELCNPLGSSRKKHKLGCFYYTLGNIRPKYRSALKAIQILCLVEVPLLEKYGDDQILAPAVEDLKKLEEGVEFHTCAGPVLFFGTFATVAGDNPGSAAVGGFKEGSSAFRPCRQCLGTKDEMSTKFHEKHFILRNPTDHDQHCQKLEDPSLSDHYSITYGVNRKSILNSLSYFHVCDETMPPDLMHDVLEGYLPYKAKLMLQYFIREMKYLTHCDLNHSIANFEYGSCECTRTPSPIATTTLMSSDKTCLGQNASQMWTLGRLLPVMIGHLIPEDDAQWQHYLQLLDIMDILFCPEVSPGAPGVLEVLIEENLEEFTSLYPGQSVIPKMHFITHMPRFMARLGPLTRHWTMRYEAKHQYLKSLATRMGNFINVCYSLALRHQSYQCYLQSSESGICVDKQDIGNGKTIYIYSSKFKEQLVALSMSEEDKLFSPRSVEIHGMSLKPGVAVLTGTDDPTNPQFATVQQLFIKDGQVLLGVQYLRVLEYAVHYHSWVVQPSDELAVMRTEHLPSRQVLTLRPVRGSYHGCFFVTLKYGI